MNLRFFIDYRTNWGQYMCVELTMYTYKNLSEKRTCRLFTSDGYKWEGEIMLSNRDIKSFEYRYILLDSDLPIRKEWNKMPRRFPNLDADMEFHDFWFDSPAWNYLYTSAFSSSSLLDQTFPPMVCFGNTLIFTVHAPQLKENQILGLLGNSSSLGSWDVHRVLRMQKIGVDFWFLILNSSALQFPFEYKYVVLEEKTGSLVQWEDGNNRISPAVKNITGKIVVLNDVETRLSFSWQRLAGVVIPLFSLRSEESQGVGDFSDLRRMIGWASSVGMHAVQILPINDTIQEHSWKDSYPYNVVSVHALHPMYLDLRKLPPIRDNRYMEEFEKDCSNLNDKETLEYDLVNRLKNKYLTLLYKQEYKSLSSDSAYLQFCQQNAEWLLPYKVFCMLRDRYHTADFHEWSSYSEYHLEEVKKLAQEESYRVDFYAYQQYLLHVQLSDVSAYARSKNVLLKGDIPIGVSRNSVESWALSDFFHMDGQAGAPPDDFSTTGQNWGFPTYNWESMSADGYLWWKSRLQSMANYFDAFRIDHVLGFFRIWEIPLECVDGLLGHFYPALPLSKKEIENYGFSFDEEKMTRPLITDEILSNLFGTMADVVKKTYLTTFDDGTYSLLPQYATQRLVEKAFSRKRSKRELTVRDGLYRLISNVLFLRDKKNPSLFHPRIDAHKDFFYATLNPSQQYAFSKLYEDFFYHRHNEFWDHEARKKFFSIVESTRMLCCAEDLGMVPSCVGQVMKDFGMLSLEIESMPKAMGNRFARLKDNPYCSVSTLFTHDMPTLRLWWEESPERTQQYYTEILDKEGNAPESVEPSLAEEILYAHLQSPSMLCLLSFQDWLSIDADLRRKDYENERINIPANPRHYWRYRMHIPIEQLCKATDLNDKIRKLIAFSGRHHH